MMETYWDSHWCGHPVGRDIFMQEMGRMWFEEEDVCVSRVLCFVNYRMVMIVLSLPLREKFLLKIRQKG